MGKLSKTILTRAKDKEKKEKKEKRKLQK